MTCDIWKNLIQNSSWQEMSLKALRTLWIYWVFQRFLWSYLEMNCVLNSCNLLALYVLPLCRDVWLLGDYLARYYSLCDIGILALVFVMVIEFCLCDGDELRLCNARLVPSLWWRWVPPLWWQISSGCVSVMSSIFVTENEFCLCHDIVMWPWVGFSGFGMVFYYRS